MFMLYVPFIFFSIFLYHSIKHRGLFSIATLLIFVYVLTSFFSILLDVTDAYQRNCEKIEINLFPTIAYCLLLFVTISPFYKLQDNNIVHFVRVENAKILDWIVVAYAIMFVLMVIILTPDLIRNWTIATINENLKAELRFGDEKAISVTGWKLFIANRCILLSFGSLNILPIFFYNICFRNKKKYFHFITIIASMTMLFTSVLHQDRSRIVYWMMLFAMCYVFFYKFMNVEVRKKMKHLFYIIITLCVSYVVIMNIRRFYVGSEDNIESLLGIVNYAGQSFFNFCHFFETVELNKINITAGFPITSYLLGIDISSADWYDYVENTTGFYAVVFSTFIGELISYMGIPLTLFWVFMYYFITKINIKLKVTNTITFYKFQILFTLFCVPYLGIFAHYFHAFITELLSIMFIIVAYLATYKRIR